MPGGGRGRPEAHAVTLRSAGHLLGPALALVLAACATASGPQPAPSPPAPPASGAPSRGPIAATVGATQSGEASWYGANHQGRPTASGESFDMHALTAAHPTLPLGTYLLVTNLNNGRAVRVRINDRGPDAPGRIVDLSYAAAQVLGYVSAGLAPVRIRVLSLPR